MADDPPEDAAPSDDAEEAMEATEEASGTEDTTPIDAPPHGWRLKWDERKPSPAKTVELRVPANAYFFFKDYELKDIKALRSGPAILDQTGPTKRQRVSYGSP